MQQRKSGPGVYGRPSGTDGSDYSYRMVVDSRYTKVAKGRSRLATLLSVQAVVQVIGPLLYALLKEKINTDSTLAISSFGFGFVSLTSGELGRRRSRVNFLKVHIVASLIATCLSLFLNRNFALEVYRGLSGWEEKKFELLELGRVLVGFLIQIFAVSTTSALIHNMSPPKRSS